MNFILLFIYALSFALGPLLGLPRLKLSVDRAAFRSEHNPHLFFSEMLADLEISYVAHPHSAGGLSLTQIPQTGPVIVVSNHPLGFVDALILADFIASQRTDYKILSNALLKNSVPEAVSKHLIAVDLWSGSGLRQEQQRIIAESRQHLLEGGVLGIFPSGAASLPIESDVGTVILDSEWKSGVARMIAELEGIAVTPVFFGHHNSRFFYNTSRRVGAFAEGVVDFTGRLGLASRSAQARLAAREAGAAFVRQALFAREFLRRRGEAFHLVVGDSLSSEALNSIDVGDPYSSEHRKAIAELLRKTTYRMSHSLPLDDENLLRLRELFPLPNLD